MPLSDYTNIAIYVTRLFEEHTKPWHLYHNLEHTRTVVKHTVEIGYHYLLSDEQYFILQSAAWFHDTGQLSGDMTDHEKVSVDLMKMYMISENVPEVIQDQIVHCIMATRMPVHPVSLLEKILCDADTFHVGTPDFERIDQLVWDELELRTGTKIEDRTERSLKFLQMHTWHTNYCQDLLTEGKKENIQLLMKKKQG